MKFFALPWPLAYRPEILIQESKRKSWPGHPCLGLKFGPPSEEGETQISLHEKWSGAPLDSWGISAGLLLQKYGFYAYILNFSKIFDTKGGRFYTFSEGEKTLSSAFSPSSFFRGI
ncbi:MAG: hypothetical protein J0652_03680 [Desulfobulbaceae bacterium]|nr:hypothetical protein [Desulfobulbaceae bacterium]